ncbi:acyltransferase, partial [Streptococcus pyogenes]|uniref:acyltransferase family protein n=1 Tax=Streptococcus pyogenes TaxID=1314 RepID=UPI0011E79964
FHHITAYLFGFALASLLASIMIYAASALHEQTPHVQEPKAITFIAVISYCIYLFHWPFYIIFSQLMSHILAVILTFFFSILFATVSYYIVEPLVQGRKPHLLGLEIDCSPYSKWIVVCALALALLTLGTCMIAPIVGKFR